MGNLHKVRKIPWRTWTTWVSVLETPSSLESLDHRRFINIVQQCSFLPIHLDSSQICMSPRLSNSCKWLPLVSEAESWGILLQFSRSSSLIAHLLAHIGSTSRIHFVSLSTLPPWPWHPSQHPCPPGPPYWSPCLHAYFSWIYSLHFRNQPEGAYKCAN